MHRRYHLAAIACCLACVPACAGTPGGPEPLLTVEKVAGDGGSVVAGGALSPDPAVRVARGDRPVAGVFVRFRVHPGEGMVTDTLVSTGSDGWARTTWLLGPAPGRQTLSAEVEGAAAEFSATADAPAPGTSYLGRNNYVEYIPGELPLIISAPHGGNLRPEEIPDRTEGTVVQDANTEDLARRVATALRDLTGKRPHLVITHLHRRKLDTNREIGEAAQGNRLAERAWNEYHGWLEVARHVMERDHARGLYVDIHGHGHEIQRLELGYLLSASDLANSNQVLNQPLYAAKSSIHALSQRSPLDFATLLRGPTSLGALLTRAGYPAVPSHTDPHPTGEPYFSGGYSTGRYGSRDGGLIDGVQIEANFRGVRDTPENREAFARALAGALLEFLKAHMGMTLAEPVAELGRFSEANMPARWHAEAVGPGVGSAGDVVLLWLFAAGATGSNSCRRSCLRSSRQGAGARRVGAGI